VGRGARPGLLSLFPVPEFEDERSSLARPRIAAFDSQRGIPLAEAVNDVLRARVLVPAIRLVGVGVLEAHVHQVRRIGADLSVSRAVKANCPGVAGPHLSFVRR
jgi:hypothetical protein